MVTVHFVGGPLSGTKRTHPHDPQQYACGDAARAKGMYGMYYTKRVDGAEVYMEWRNLKKPQ